MNRCTLKWDNNVINVTTRSTVCF